MVFLKSSVPALQKVISQVQAIDIVRIGEVLSPDTVYEMLFATDLLSESQARLALSYTGLTSVEIEDLLAKKALIATGEKLTANRVVEVAGLKDLTISETGATMVALKEAEAQGTLTLATIAASMALDGFSKEQINAVLSGILLEKQNKKTTGSMELLGKSILEKLGNPLTLLIIGIAGTIVALNNLRKEAQNVADSAQELGSQFKKEKDEINEYKEKIEEYRKTISDSKSSVDDVIDARKNLISIQDELISKYGSEIEHVRIITDAVNGEADAYERLKLAKWDEKVKEFNKGGGFANFFAGYDDNMDRMYDLMENNTSILRMNMQDFYNETNKELIKYLQENGWNLIDESETNTMAFSKNGTTKDIYNDLLDIQRKFNDIPNSFNNSIIESVDATSSILEKYGDMYNEAIFMDKIYGNDANYNLFKTLQSEYDKYRKGVISGDEELANESLHVLADHLRAVFDDENLDDAVKAYFRDLFPTIFIEEEKSDILEAYKKTAKTRAASLSSGYDGRYAIGEGYIQNTFNKEWSEEYDKFVKKHNVNSEEKLDRLNEFIARYHDLPKATKEYLKVVENETGILDYTNKKDRSKYTGAQYVDDAQSEIKQLGDTLKQLEEGTLDDTALLDFFQDFPEFIDDADNLGEAIKSKLAGAIEELEELTGKELPQELKNSISSLAYTATNANRTLNEAFNKIKDSSKVYKDFGKAIKEGNVDESMLSSIAGLSDRLDTMVAGYYGGVVTIEELYAEVEKQREIDFENYKQSYIMKQAMDKEFYEHATASHLEIVKYFKEVYNIDLQNFKTYQQAKQQVEKTVLGENAQMIAKYYDAQKMVYTEEYKRLDASARNGDEWANTKKWEVDQLVKAYEEAIGKLNEIGWKDFEDSINNMTLGNFDKIRDASSGYEELFDFFERRIEVIDQALNKLDASLENVNGSMSKNILIAGKIGIVSEEIKDYSSALIMYEDQANKELAKLDADLQDKIKNGAVDLTKLMGEGGEEVNKILTEYQNWANKVNDCNQKLLELKETLRDLALDKFNNIVQDFTDEFELIGSASSFIDKQISLFEEAGQIIGKGFYEAQIEVSRKQRNLLEKEKAELINELSSSIANGYIQKGTDEWLEMVNSIKEVDESILDCDQSIEQLQNSILELSDQAFERLQNQFSSLKDQLNNINSLIDEIDVSDEEGVWSKEGITRLGMFAEQYELARHNVEKYQEQIDQLNDSYANGLYSTTEYLDKLSELTEQQWSEALAAEDAKKSIMDLNKARVDLIKEGIQKQIDKYKELIDAQKKALDQDKDLHDWQKTLAEKNKNITKLQNQIAVLSNDDSASANAKRIKLQQELNEALEDLEETQYDHSIEKQKEALDQQMEDFEDERQKEIDALEEYLKDTEKVQKDSFEVIKKNTNAIAETIAELVKTHGVIVSETITNSWKQGENAIAAYGETLAVESSGFMSEINILELYLGGLQAEADITAAELANIFTAKADNLVMELNSTRDTEMDLINATNMLQSALIKTLEGGYDNSRIINSLREIQEEFDRTRQKANDTSGGDNPGGKKPAHPDEDHPDEDHPTEPKKTSVTSAVTSTVQNAVALIKDTASKATIYSPGSGAAQGTPDAVTTAQNARRAEEQASALLTQAQIQAQQETRPDLKTSALSSMGLNQKAAENEIKKLKFNYDEYYNVSTGRYSSAYEQLARNTQYSEGAAKQKKEIDDAIADYKARQAAILQKYSGYAVGVHKLKADEMAWTQELGQEAILSPTRNAILTKLNKGDTVLTAEQTDNLFKLSKIDPSTIFGKLKMPTYSSKTMTPVLTIGNVLTVNGNIDDTNVDKMKGFVNNAITKAFKDFSSEIIKR